MAAARVTVGDALRRAEDAFAGAYLHFGHGTHNAADEAAWLVTHLLRIPHERLGESLERPLTPAQRERLSRLVSERVRRRVPLAYLLREAWLGEHRFYVDERVIVPRSYIAELLRDRLSPWVSMASRVARALDMCTGSGCLAVLLALAFPRARVDAVDVSPGALAVARRNIAAYRLKSRARLVRSDLFTNLRARPYDVIVANPPYVDARAMKRIPAEYGREPRLALAGGDDGLRFVRRILREAGRFLKPGGLLVVEIGRHRRELERAFPRTPFTWLETSAGDGLVFLLHREDLPGTEEVQSRSEHKMRHVR
ncbi:MAG TPA: 50S ribosomal protein L3 N(5)-glutamine methyltransferase [Burkholderiales bacterium]|nr:50S ribosomal protein L3 N(5)-glutamine methyltransferase [Burkholderiales bacterium]